MKHYIYFLLTFWLTASSAAAQVASSAEVRTDTILVYQPANHDSPLQERLNALLKTPLAERTLIALYVYDLTDDRPLFAHNHRQTIRPASNMKVITAVAALDLLGGDYLFRTLLYADADTQADANGTYTGNLYVRAGFDPCFDTTDLKAFVTALKQEGIRSIQGDFLLDVSIKDTARLGWGWCWDDDAETNPSLTPLPFMGKNTFTTRLAQELQNAGITLKGDIKNGRLPKSENLRLLCERTHTIDQILKPMMKQSDNLYAEALFYQMAARNGKPYATRKQGSEHIRTLVERLGFNASDFTFADGSGVSLYNYASPELLVALLRYAWYHRDIYDHLLPALPIAGVDGTLKRRMTNGHAFQNVQAKTGTVTGISTLAGYATAPNGHRLCFSIMNSGQQRAAVAREFQDNVCQTLTRP